MVSTKRHPEDISAPEEQRGTPTRFKIMVEQKQTGSTPTSTGYNQLETGTERVIREGQPSRHRKSTRKKTKTRIPINFKGNMPEVGAVIRTKDKNYEGSFQNLQENMLQYVVANDKKGADPAPIIGKPEDVYLSRKEPGTPTGPGSKGASDIAKKRHEIQLEKLLDRINT